MAEETDIHVQALSEAQKQMYDSRFDAALETIQPVLEASPDHVDALYMRAVCARYLKRHDAARAALDRNKRTALDFGRAFQEEGHLLRALGETDGALRAYQRACRFKPALVASWHARAELLATSGRRAEAEMAKAQANRIEALPRDLVSVTRLLHEGRLLKAEQACRAFLQKTPHHVEAMRLLAEIGSRLGVLEDADFLLESALAFEPDNTQLRLDHIQVLRKRQKFTAALEQAKYLHDSDPDNPVFKSHYAIECMQTGSFDAALRQFDEILAALPDDPATLTSRGHALKTLGRQDAAVASYRAALVSQRDHGDAWYGLANLKTYRFDDDEIAAMLDLEAGPDLAFQDRVHIRFALAKAFEDRGEIATSFGFYDSGNTLKRVQSRYTTAQMEAELHAQAEICTADLFAAKAGRGCPDADPIFIVGLPRAGSTLLEQILASQWPHSQTPAGAAASRRPAGRR